MAAPYATGLEALSDADLMALKNGDITKVSDAGLAAMQLEAAKATPVNAQPAPGPKGVLENMGAGFMGAARGAGQVLDATGDAGRWLGGAMTDMVARSPTPEAAPIMGTLTSMVPEAVTALGGAALKPGANAIRKGAEWLMKVAVNPSLKDMETAGKVPRAMGTMLDKGSSPFLLPGTNVTPGGLDFLRGTGRNAVGEAQAVVDASPKSIAMSGDANQATRDAMGLGGPQDTLSQITKVENDFKNHPAIGDLNSIPIQQAQQLKQGFYKQVDDSFGVPDINGTTNARKELARLLKEEIEKAEPGVIQPNATASEMFNAANVMKRRALTAGNRSPVSIAPFAHDVGGALAFLTGRSPLAQSIAARLLNQTQRVPGSFAGTALAAKMGIPDDQDKVRQAALAEQLRSQ